MVKLMSDWLFERYAKLWNAYGIKKFSFENAKRLLKEKNENLTNVVLFKLKKEDVLRVIRAKKDKRIKQYWLKSPSLWVHEKLKQVK